MLFQLARYLPEPYKEPSIRKLHELCNLREEAGSAYVKIVGSFRYQKDSDPYADLYSFRTAYLEFMASHPQSLEVREKNPKNLRAKTTDLDNRAKINSTDGLLNIRNDNPISLDELIDHIVKVHAHPDNLIPVGISTLDYEVVRSAPERVRQISLTLIFNAYLQIYNFDREIKDPSMPLFVHQDLRILTYVGALLTEDLSIAPHLSEFEHNELHTYKEKVEPKVGNLFDLTF